MLASIVRESCQSDRFAARSLLPQEKDRASCKVVFLVLWLPWAFILCYMYVGEVDKNDEITSYMYYKINIAVANGVIKSTFIWLTEQYSTTLSCRSSLRMGWSVEFVTWNGSKHTDRECVNTSKRKQNPAVTVPSPLGHPQGFLFSVWLQSHHTHTMKRCQMPLILFGCFAKSSTLGCRGQTIPKWRVVVVTIGIDQCISAVDWCM